MKRISFILITLQLIIFISCISGPSDVDPQSTIEGTIQKAINLLEQENYRAVFTEIAHPEDITALTVDSNITLGELIKDFHGKPAEYLLQILTIIQSKDPVLNPDKSRAEWKISGDDMEDPPPQPVVMEKFEDKWYLRN